MQVSVVIPVYNAEPYVREAVESALAQPETAEVILIEDGSPDGSLAVCQSLAQGYEKVTLLQHPDGANRGAGASRNLGIQHCQYEIVAFLDADDTFLPNRFALARDIYEADPEVDGILETVDIQFENEAMRQRWGDFAHKSITQFAILREAAGDDMYRGLVLGGVGNPSTDGVSVRKRIFERSGYFDEHLLLGQDKVLWIKMAGVGKLVTGSREVPVAAARMHPNNRQPIKRPRREQTEIYDKIWETLWLWGRDNLPPEKQAVLDEAMMRFHSSGYTVYSLSHSVSRFVNWSLRMIHSKGRLLRVLFRHPVFVTKSVFWKKLFSLHPDRFFWG